MDYVEVNHFRMFAWVIDDENKYKMICETESTYIEIYLSLLSYLRVCALYFQIKYNDTKINCIIDNIKYQNVLLDSIEKELIDNEFYEHIENFKKIRSYIDKGEIIKMNAFESKLCEYIDYLIHKGF
jgi:hypothetical protein